MVLSFVKLTANLCMIAFTAYTCIYFFNTVHTIFIYPNIMSRYFWNVIKAAAMKQLF
jgi:hypothetical protein